MVSKIVRFLGSIQLAVPLMVAIATVAIAATFYESEVGSATVQHDIYKSAWFGALMFLLAVNLGVSTLTRYPWRGSRKVGFAITHLGLIVLIAGSAAVIHLSTEGMLLVRTDGAANARIRLEGDFLEAIAPDGTRQQTDIFIKPNGSIYPSQLGDLSLLGYSENAIETVSFVDGGAIDNLAVKLQLHSDRMGQTLERWLAIAPTVYSTIDIGPARLEIVRAENKDDLETLLSPPDRDRGLWGMLEITTAKGTQDIEIGSAMGKAIELDNNIAIEVVNAWPDFRLDANNQPTSASEIFRNPAVQLTVTQAENRERWFVFAAGFEPIRSGDDIALDANSIVYQAPQATVADYFRIVESKKHELFYAARSSKGFISGKLALGQSIVPGWADFEITLAETVDRARVQRTIVPVTPVAENAVSGQESPALHVAMPEGSDTWLAWGEPKTIETASGDYFLAFSPKLLQLPFTVKLNDFIIDRNEGSESVAMWTSIVTLSDPHKGKRVQRRIWMNHPTWFDGWKLAQASWNPGDLHQSTLQLKREPWWVTALTWSGSLLVVLGIGTMFYGGAIVRHLNFGF